MSDALKPQPAPKKNDLPAMWALVIADAEKAPNRSENLLRDMRARDEQGLAKYGVRLQPFNGRDALYDAYQEVLDLCVYTKQALFEAEEKNVVLAIKINYAYGEALALAHTMRELLDRRDA